MTAQIDSARLNALLQPHGFAADGAEALVLVACRTATVAWASAAALAALDASDAAALGDRLFRDSAAGRAYAARLARLSAGGAYRLDRLSLAERAAPLVIACHAVDEAGAPMALLHLRNSAVAPLAAPIPEHSAPVAGPSAAALAPRPEGATTRILWETDAAGRVTRIGPEAALLGPGAPRLGDDLPATLQAWAPDLAERIAEAAQRQGSVGLTRIHWPREGAEIPPIVEVGCAAKRGGAPGLRGFFALHGVMPELPLQDAPAAASAHESAAPASPPDEACRDSEPAPAPDAPVTAEPPAITPEFVTADAAAPVEIETPAAPLDAAVAAEPPATVAEPVATDEAEAGRPEIPAAPPTPPKGGNVVHFPLMRLGTVPANFVPALKPAAFAGPVLPDAVDLPEPQWSEAPAEPPTPSYDAAMDSLSADERDAFEHIRKVLGTRPFAPAPPAERAGPPAGAAGLPPGLAELLDHVPVALRLDSKDASYANAALRGRADAAPDDAAAETARFDLAGSPATLTIFPGAPRTAQPSAAEAIDLVTDGYLRLDENGDVLALSPKAARLLGLEGTAAQGRAFTSLLFDGQAPGWQALAAAATGPEAQPQGPSALRLRHAGGQPVAVQVRLGRSEGALLCALTLDRPAATPANDTAEAARQEAERTSALKSEFLAKVSHEIRTPLNAILGFAEVIRDERLGPVGNPRYLEYMRDIHASGTHVMSLVNDLLDLSRIEAGRMDLNLEAVDANAIVQACVNTLQTKAHRQRVIVRLSLTPRLPATLADERSLRQILLNLLANAIKFNEPGGQVIVSTARAGPEAVAIRIRDTGIGMSEEEIEAAMEPFRQLSTINRTGSGLGLPLTKALVEANCATMTIKSAPQEGTLVEVVFPLVEADSVSLPAE